LIDLLFLVVYDVSMKKRVKITKMTIDKLAIMVAKGFENTATKEDLRNLEERMNGKFDGVNKRIDDFVITRVKI